MTARTMVVDPKTIGLSEATSKHAKRPAQDGTEVIITFSQPMQIKGVPIHLAGTGVWMVLPMHLRNLLLKTHSSITFVHEGPDIAIKVKVTHDLMRRYHELGAGAVSIQVSPIRLKLTRGWLNDQQKAERNALSGSDKDLCFPDMSR